MPEKKIILSADSACDIGDELKAKYSVNTIAYTIVLEEKKYTDGVDISPDDMYKVFYEKKLLPKTSAINAAEYEDYFKQWTDKGYEVIHFTLSSAITSSYQSCCIAAEELPGVYVIDSKNISSGIALLIAKAGDMIADGKSASEIVARIEELREKSHCSFVLETLDFMRAGGRCSDVAAFAASLLNLKICIEVDNKTGSMHAGKKFRGSMDKVLLQYATERLEKYPEIDPERVYITHSGVPQERINAVREVIEKSGKFKEIYISRASSVISTHCGPGTLGVLFMEK